jgi:hypothetical protein
MQLRNDDKSTFDAISMLTKSHKSILEPEFVQYAPLPALHRQQEDTQHGRPCRYLKDNPDASDEVRRQAEEHMGGQLSHQHRTHSASFTWIERSACDTTQPLTHTGDFMKMAQDMLSKKGGADGMPTNTGGKWG